MALEELEARIASAVEAVAPSVAVVESLKVGRKRGGSPVAFPSQATGVVTDRSGYLVTNQHVVDGATEVRARLSGGREVTGEVVGGDAVTDIALVRVDADDLVPARIGDSEALRVGQIVLAMGNALGLPGDPTVSMGVVSALGRPLPGSDFVFEGLVQTDAAINPGNSGGPLVDLSGSVVGINAAMIPFAQGVGFAIPIHAVARIAEELRLRRRIVRPWLGVMVAELRPDLARQHGLEPRSGLLVAEVVPRSPAHRAGLKPGDVVAGVGPFAVRTVRELLESLSKFPVGSEVALSFRRRGNVLSTSVPLQENPEVAPDAA
ncbi:MAG TPA: trypsin-like peptidase domain-containing protein [Thermoplasmata archaeon]|nr:trypsin-like peptidase domain-containing protein [Thermoplasmata archaeon]